MSIKPLRMLITTGILVALASTSAMAEKTQYGIKYKDCKGKEFVADKYLYSIKDFTGQFNECEMDGIKNTKFEIKSAGKKKKVSVNEMSGMELTVFMGDALLADDKHAIVAGRVLNTELALRKTRYIQNFASQQSALGNTELQPYLRDYFE